LSDDKWLAQVSWAGENLFLGTDTSGHTVVYDSADEAQKGIGPMRALLTSLGACTGMDIVAILNKRKQKLRSLKVLLSGDRPDHGLPKPWTAIHIRYVLSGDSLQTKYVEEAIKESTEKFCSVGATLQPTAKISHSYEIVP
jgi:putative redox protein